MTAAGSIAIRDPKNQAEEFAKEFPQFHATSEMSLKSEFDSVLAGRDGAR
jgi:hypothetical protein